MRLNLGCGDKMRAGDWLNIDSRALPAKGHQFLRADIRNLKGVVHDGVVDEVLAWDILEHMPRADAECVLDEIARMLRPGGQVEFKMPEIGLLLAWSQGRDHREVSFRWYGQHDVDPHWMYPQNVHMYVWAKNNFIQVMEKKGFRFIEAEACEETNMRYRFLK